MARTLIGNIKGKDGRGISKVEKTATTGVVDTYTITYTDGTKSTFEVRNSDDIAIQRQIVPSAAVESSTTASQAYDAGDYVVVNGVLRKVKAAIAKGNTISNSNSTATTVSGELATLGDSVTQGWKPPFTESKITLARSGNVVTLSGNVKFDQSGACDYAHVSESIPLGFRPMTDDQSAVFAMPTNRMALLVNHDGSVTALGDPSSASACCSGCWITSDKWPTE